MDVFGINLIQLLENTFNFLLLTILLTIFAYRPVLAMLDKRKKMIEKSMQDAADIEKQKLAMQKEYKKIIHDAQEESKRMVDKAMEQSQVIAKQINDDAKTEAQGLLTKASEDIERQKAQIKSELSSELTMLIGNALREVLVDSLSEQEQERLVVKTLDKLTS